MNAQETKETLAVISAHWWAQGYLYANATIAQWKAYAASFEFNIEFFLTPDPRTIQ